MNDLVLVIKFSVEPVLLLRIKLNIKDDCFKSITLYLTKEAVGYFPYNIKSLQIISLQHNIPTDNFPTFFCPYR